jgi:hypothetical protein
MPADVETVRVPVAVPDTEIMAAKDARAAEIVHAAVAVVALVSSP